MKILLVTQYYYPERFSTTDIAEELVKLGHEVSVVTAKPCYGFDRIPKEYKKINFEIINGVKVHRVNILNRGKNAISLSLNYLSFHMNAKRYVKTLKEKFDVVLAISLSPVISISPAIKFAKRNNIPCLLYCEDIWPESPVSAGMVKKESFIYKILLKWSKAIYSKIDNIMVSSPSFKEYFEDTLNVKDKGFRFIPQPSMDNNEYVSPVEFKDEHNIVYAGNIGALQQVDKLVKAMKLVEGVKLHILGSGSELQNVLDLIKQEHLEDKVIYEGSYPLVIAESFYKNADALVVSLKGDTVVGKTIPNKVVQYLKYVKPILGIIKGDGRDLLMNAKGSVISEDDVESIASNINHIVSLSKSEKETMGKNNLTYFKENLELSKLVKDIEKELKEATK